MRKISLGAAACAAALLVGAVVAQDRPRERTVPAGAGSERDAGFYRASEILGSTVRGSDGQELGQIQDLLIERRNQQIRYFILGEGETLEAQSSVRVVPWMVARPVFEGDQRFVDVRIDQRRFQQAPTFTFQEIQAGPAGWSTEIDQFFGASARGRSGRPGANLEAEGDVEGRAQPARPGREDRPDAERDANVEREGAAARARDRARARTGARPNPDAAPDADAADRPAEDAADRATDAADKAADDAADRATEDAPKVEAEVEPDGDITIEPKND